MLVGLAAACKHVYIGGLDFRPTYPANSSLVRCQSTTL